MYPISSTALAKFQSGAMQYARITNGNTTITNANIVQGGMSINRYVATGESVSVGSCVAAELSLVLSNRDGSWNSYSFDGKEFFVEVGVYTSASTITYIPMGYFTVDEVKFDRNTVTLAALDRMVKFDDAIDLTQFTFPYTLKTLLERICTVCGVTLGTTGNFINYGRSVASMPSEAKTYRDVLRWICELAGTNGYISYDGNFYMTWYRDTSGFTITTANRTASEIDENTFAITGVTIIKDETTYTAGTNTRPLTIQDNPLATSNLSTIADNIATYRNGFTWTPFSATVLPAPHLYPLDHCTFVKKDNTNADVYITTVTYKLNGNTTIAGTGDAKHKGRSYGLQDSTFYANNIAAGAITADKITAGAITADKIAANAITTEKIDPSVDMATNTGVAATYATKAAAASSNQRIYYRTSSSSAPTAPSTWVTSTSTANNTWSTKRMQYDSTYKYLWTCIQTKTVSGSVSNSTVLLDDTTTVIDGGNIITGTVDANQIKAGAITAEKINSSVDMATNAGVASTYATKTNSVKREQRIYRKNNSTTAPAAPTSWITSTSVTSSAWTTKRMSYDSSYPYLWTCLQTETNDGTITCSTVLLDDTLTVIDGGKIITGTVAANQIATGAITAEKINSSVDMATNAGVAATYATKTNAVKREQRIYRKNNSTTAPTAPTSWITSTSATSSAWTTKRMSYDASYPYLWTCLQTETNDGTITCSTVLLDDTLTVIDGGNIITGSVAANAVNVTDLSAFQATIGGWNIDTYRIYKEFTSDGYVYQVLLNAPPNPVPGNIAIGIRKRAIDSETWTYLAYFNYGGQLISNDATIRGTIVSGDFTANGKVRIAPDYDLQEAGVYALELVDQFDQSTIINPDFANIAKHSDGSGVHIDESYVSVQNYSGATDTIVELENLGAGSTGLKITEGNSGQAGYKESYLGADQLKVNNQDLIRLTPKLTQAFSTAIPANADLNTVAYLPVGQYNTAASVTAATQTNCPTARAYNMKVENVHSDALDNESTATYVYRLRTITNIDGEIYVQSVYSGSTAGTFTFGAWKKLTVGSDLATVATSGSYNDLSNKPSLATVATSGSYDDLSNKPTITDTKVTQTVTTTSASYPLLFGNTSVAENTQASTATEGARISGGLYANPNVATIYVRRIHSGTTSQNGRIVLGNSVANGTAGCSHGEVVVYGKSNRYARFYDKDNVLTANREYYFPDQSGTLVVDAVTSGSGTRNTTNTSLGTCSYTKLGKIVSVTVYSLLLKSTVADGDVLFTGLPAPSAEHHVGMPCVTASTSAQGDNDGIEAYVDTSGNLKYTRGGSIISNKYYAASFTYISAS